MKKYIISFALLALMASCAKNKVEEVILTDDVVKSATTLECDTVFKGEQFHAAKSYYHYNDSLMIVLNDKQENSYFIEFYNTKTDSIVKQLFMVGKGSKEMLSAELYLSGSKMFVRDVVKQQLAEINVDKLLNDNTYKFDIDNRINFGIASFAKYDGNYVFENPFSFVDKNAGIVQEEDRLITSSEMERLYDVERDYNTVNVSSCGKIIVNENKERIIYASTGQSKLELFDKDLNLVKRVLGPITMDTKYYLTDSDPKEVIYYKKIPFTYMGYCSSKDYLFLNYIGDFMEGNTLEDKICYIMQFDWDGNLVKCYNSNKYITALSCDRDAKSIGDIYATVLDNEGKLLLVQFHEKK